MSRAVLMSIKPKWCKLVEESKKTIEVRKSSPKLETPFKCYIYQTKGGKVGTGLFTADGEIMGRSVKNGTVIGEFVCDSIRSFDVPYPAFQNRMDKTILEQSCLSYNELHMYAYHDALYSWHISDLVIYDKPKELYNLWHLKRPPQSWCYVEEV